VQATATINGVALASGGAWSPRDTVSFTCTFTSGLMGGFRNQKMKILYNLTYQTSSIGLPHTADGEVFAEVQ
jgi:hypothetical protein